MIGASGWLIRQSRGFMTRRLNVLIGLAVIGLALAGTAWANGEEFFSTGDTKLDFYYFGHIKDTDGSILDNAVITVTAKNVPIKFPFRNDAPGHFRSPDIGRAIKALGKPVDPSQIEVAVLKKGYTLARAIAVPNKKEGGVELTIVMQPAAAPAK